MAKLVFVLEGEHSDLEWVRTKIDGSILDILDENQDRLDETIDYGWEYDD